MKLTVRQLRHIIEAAAFPTWEELSKKDQIASIYSDVYKEKYGIRPRGMKWDDLTDEEAEAELERLYAEKGTVDWNDEPEPEYPGMEGTVGTDEPGDPHERLPLATGMGQRHREKTRLHGPNVNRK